MAKKKADRPHADPRTAIIADYEKSVGLYRDFALRIRDLLEQMLAAKQINIHSVTCRPKERDSLKQKLHRPEKEYSVLADVTDLAGVRIICYFADDVDRIADVITKEFAIDKENSIDKRQVLEPDQFGYLSLHHVVTLTEARARLAEYMRFRDLKVEIQTRSILQHAWAEIEHDLGYKSSLEVPKHLRRRVSRLAGLLELADQEFFTVRDQIALYKKTLDAEVVTNPSAIELNKPALTAFALRNKAVRSLDAQIAEAANCRLSRDPFVEYELARLAWLGIRDLGSVTELLTANSKWIVPMSKHFLVREEERGSLSRGVSLFYLAYVLAAQLKTQEEIQKFVREGMGINQEDMIPGIAENIKAAWNSVIGVGPAKGIDVATQGR